MTWARRVAVAVVAVVVLVAAAWFGYRLTADPPATGAVPSAPPTSPSTSTEPDRRIDPAPDEPADFYAGRVPGSWAQVIRTRPDGLPEVGGPPMDSRAGAGDCAPPYRAARAAGGVDAHRTDLRITVIPRSFKTVTVTALRIRRLDVRWVGDQPRYLYLCKQPLDSGGWRTDFEVHAHEAEVHEPLRDGDALPQTVTADRSDVWWVVGTVVAMDNVHQWQVEVDYTADGVPRTKVLDRDGDGQAFVTEAAQRTYDLDETFAWCTEPGSPGFRTGC
ncbi:hypothetical protein ABTZ99_35255 [Actinosynnema sp. NPDC002837]